MSKEVIVTKINSAHVTLSDFCSFSNREGAKERDELIVTEWSNGEGYDIHVSTYNTKNYTYTESKISLTHRQYEAIKKCIKKLEKN